VTTCGTCGHEREHHDRGGCQVVLRAAGRQYECQCTRWVSLGALLGLRLLVGLILVVVFGSLPAFVELVAEAMPL
jgi:hypothetical protein